MREETLRLHALFFRETRVAISVSLALQYDCVERLRFLYASSCRQVKLEIEGLKAFVVGSASRSRVAADNATASASTALRVRADGNRGNKNQCYEEE